MHKGHPIPRPNRRAVGCLFWGYLTKNDRVIHRTVCIQTTSLTYNVKLVCASLDRRILTHCGLVTPHDVMNLGQHWLR